MAITSMDSLVAALPGQRKCAIKTYTQTGAGGPYRCSSWSQNEGFPGKGANPGSTAGVVPTSATAGAIAFTNPGAGLNSYLAQLIGQADGANVMLHVYDRLVHSDGLSGTVTTSQTVGTPAITRPDANGDNVELFIEIYSAVGSTGQTITTTYTNQAGTGSRSATCSFSSPSNIGAGRLIAAKLQSGDTGVRSVQSLQLSGSTTGAGNFGVTLARRIASLPVQDGEGVIADAVELGLPRIYDDACLFYVITTHTFSIVNVWSQLTIAQG